MAASHAQGVPVVTTNKPIYQCDMRLAPPNCYKINADGTRTEVKAPKAAPLPPATTEGKKIYKCYVDGYDPPVCVEVPIQNGKGFTWDAESIDPAGIANAMRTALAYKQRLAQGQAINVGDPVTEGCSNSHGQSGCCKVIATDPLSGILYIECG